MPVRIYIARHALPDWSRTDLQYDVLPGPPLTPHGDEEARLLGRFLQSREVVRLYASPFDRTHRTAMLASEEMDLEPVIESAIAEWRRDETVDMVASRLMPFWERLCVESEQIGPVCIVTHGGPLRLLLHRLGVRKEVIESYTSRYDSHNPAPPAGTWLAQRDSATSTWHLELVFTPSGLL